MGYTYGLWAALSLHASRGCDYRLLVGSSEGTVVVVYMS